MSCACWRPSRAIAPVDKRDRAILMLFIAYGLRAGEVGGLRLDDLDWENETLRVRCPKPGRTHRWPLSRGSDTPFSATYGSHGRPASGAASSSRCARRSGRSTGRRWARSSAIAWRRIGIVAGRRGTHALRHAAAQHLLDQGMSMKVIGDFLGHRDPSSTAIYAKVNLTALREVAALDLEGLA